MRLGDLDALKEEIGSWGMNDYEPADFIDAIDAAPTVEVSIVEFKEPLPLVKAQKIVKALSKRPQGEISNDYLIGYIDGCKDTRNKFDNAPTVEVTDYDTGYQDGLEDGLNDIRPQGKWEESHIISCGNILRMGLNVIEHNCKNCGRWSIKWERTIPDNFCSNCGADMRGAT